MLITGAAFGVPQSLVNVISWRGPPPFDASKPYEVAKVTPPPGFTLIAPDPDVLGKVVGKSPKIVPPDDSFAKNVTPSTTLPDNPAALLRQFEAHATAISNLRGFLFAGVGFPIVVFVLGIAGWWVARGFKPAP